MGADKSAPTARLLATFSYACETAGESRLLSFVLQKTERESPVAFMPGMNRRSFESGGDEGEAELRPTGLLSLPVLP